MPVAAVGNSTSTTQTTTTPPPATTSPTQVLDRDAFLKLLVAQLRYQDPSKPVDASEMISQSAQLSVVDKLEGISTALAESGATNRLALGGSIIGKSITFAGTGGVTVTETVTSVSFDGTSMILKAGTWSVPLNAVRSIAEPSQAKAVVPPAAEPPADPPAA
jgi:flagellar basal-body rod modification protein FlgD